MGKYNFDEIVERRHTNSLKYDECQNPYLPEHFIPMWVADMDFACPQPILDAMKARIDKRILAYACYNLPKEYTDAVCGWLKRRHNIDCGPENISISSAVVDIYREVLASVTKDGDGIMVFTPSYTYLWAPIAEYDRKGVQLPLINTDGYYTIDWDLLEAECAKPKNTLLVLCSPHNPSGRVWKEDELRKLVDICFRNNVKIFVDEIHHDLIRRNEKMLSLHALFPHEPRIITATSGAKTFNIAGLCHAFVITFDPVFKQNHDYSRYCGSPNPLSMVALQAAYGGECDEWVDELCEYLDGNFAYLEKFLKENMPRVKFRPAEGTYLAWLDFRAYGLSDEELDKRVASAGLYLEFGDNNFVANAKQFGRVNLGCPRSVVVGACEMLKKALEG